MADKNTKVIGTYDNQDEALKVVSQLKREGYQKQDIILYSNDSSTLSDHDAVNVSTNSKEASDKTSDTNSNTWTKVKDTFTLGSYDHTEESSKEGYTQDDDVLYPYREALNDGKVVVAVDNSTGENLEKHDSSGADSDSNRNTEAAEDPLTEGRQYDRTTDQDQFNN